MHHVHVQLKFARYIVGFSANKNCQNLQIVSSNKERISCLGEIYWVHAGLLSIYIGLRFMLNV